MDSWDDYWDMLQGGEEMDHEEAKAKDDDADDEIIPFAENDYVIESSSGAKYRVDSIYKESKTKVKYYVYNVLTKTGKFICHSELNKEKANDIKLIYNDIVHVFEPFQDKIKHKARVLEVDMRLAEGLVRVIFLEGPMKHKVEWVSFLRVEYDRVANRYNWSECKCGSHHSRDPNIHLSFCPLYKHPRD